MFFNIDTILLQKKKCCYCNYSYSQKPFLKHLPLIRQTSCNVDLFFQSFPLCRFPCSIDLFVPFLRLFSSCKVLFGLPLILLAIFVFWLLELSYQHLLLNCLFVL